MPRVVPDQRTKFENEEFFRKLSRECEIKYTGFRDRPHDERQARFQNACRDGRSEIAFVATGTNLSLQFFPANLHGEQRQLPTREYVDFERETSKVIPTAPPVRPSVRLSETSPQIVQEVYLKAPMILNGVCVIWRGWIDLQRLDGMGCLEYDEERAQHEDALAQAAFEEARRRTRDFEDRDRSHREDLEVSPAEREREKECVCCLPPRRQQNPSPGSNMGNTDDHKLR
ncbi:hypothetical protein P4O66_018307 [Electrophorus voltai]|uniref:Core-binding factor subunit beta n=1 Tax=Electrophorus voltai TaxID=2609070 RepID=A0AAD8YPF5_9TELE|nr:hypothetical protein P4O66_018307 [Electrophorus voltai]